ncbi:MAG: hypothetical protein Q8S55_15235 [Methylococcaceae bacterium]|nr:hypothetical protein [Methylococcaceae bacterium]
MSEFLQIIWVQLATLVVTASIFFLIPLKWREIEAAVSGEPLKAFRKVSRDVYAQTAMLVGLALVPASIFGVVNGNLSLAILNAYIGIALSGGMVSLWTVRKAHIAYQSAKSVSVKEPRNVRLDDVYSNNLLAFTAALIAAGIGAFSLVVVNIQIVQPPSWLWFPFFLFSALPIYAQFWSLSVEFAATKYEQDPKHGARKSRA